MNKIIKTILLISVTTIMVLTTLFTINYFTVFGYYLPHKSQVIYMATKDTSAHFTPKMIMISDNVSEASVEPTTPQLTISQFLTPYGYIRSDLYDIVIDGNTKLLMIINDQNRIINVLRNTLNANGIPIPKIEYPTVEVPNIQINEKTFVSQYIKLPSFVIDEHGKWYFDGDLGYEETIAKVKFLVAETIHQQHPEIPIETISNWIGK